MMNKSAVPRASPNHQGRLLFLSVLDQEWPELKTRLFEIVGPAYQQCWREWPDTSRQPPRGFVGRQTSDGPGFIAPRAVWRWRKLLRSRKCGELRAAMQSWAATSGLGLVDEWLLESALITLDYGTSGPWRYYRFSYPHAWGSVFVPQLRDPQWLPGYVWPYGTGDEFVRRMQNEFRRELSRYHKTVMAQWGISNQSTVEYARWTVVRLSGAPWSAVVGRFSSLQRYSEGETQAKKRVRQFAAEIALSLKSRA
jgi:hypothetical protein